MTWPDFTRICPRKAPIHQFFTKPGALQCQKIRSMKDKHNESGSVLCTRKLHQCHPSCLKAVLLCPHLCTLLLPNTAQKDLTLHLCHLHPSLLLPALTIPWFSLSPSPWAWIIPTSKHLGGFKRTALLQTCWFFQDGQVCGASNTHHSAAPLRLPNETSAGAALPGRNDSAKKPVQAPQRGFVLEHRLLSLLLSICDHQRLQWCCHTEGDTQNLPRVLGCTNRA